MWEYRSMQSRNFFCFGFNFSFLSSNLWRVQAFSPNMPAVAVQLITQDSNNLITQDSNNLIAE